MKKKYVLSILLATVLFSGCGNDNKTTKEQKDANLATTTSIEVSSNDNKFEQKVEPKQKDDSSSAYYGDYNKMDSNTQEEHKQRSSLDANLNIRSPYEKVQISMIVKKLSKNFIQKCSACHDDYANGIIGPSLLGKTPDYISQKIHSFKDDKSKNVLMSELVAKMGDEEINSLANEIYNFNEEIKKIGATNANK